MEKLLPAFSTLLKSLVQLFCIMCLPIIGLAQGSLNNCDPVYEKALTAYREGRINDVPNLLKECLENWQGQRKADAYKLLTNTYLYFNERAQAENAMLNFLKLNPEYVIDADSSSENRDTPEFINLYNTFRTRPIFLIGAKAGGNWSMINGTKGFGLENEAFAGQKYKGKLGFQVGVTVEIPIWKQFSLNPELYLAVKNYSYTAKVMDFAKVDFTEKQLWVELPVLAKYNFVSGNKIRTPFVNVGGSIQYLVSASGDIIRKDAVTSDNNSTRTIDDNNVTEIYNIRNKLNYNAIVGAGIKLKNVIGRGYIIIEGRYTYGLRNIVNAKKRANSLSHSELVYDFLHVDNDFTFNTFALSLGYIVPQFKPKVLRKTKDHNQ